ncbi:MAG TPA: hypothetical protein VFL82_02155 [Thermomicrobiales bacterium]|nr:hypothetical protein [Thermomicrobiales bacterium]
MDLLKPGELGDYLIAPTYSVKVRGLKYLWGSAGLSMDVKFEKALVLHIANDLAGEPVKIGSQVASGTKTEFGTIQPGERISVSVNDLSGIYADCSSETLVHCLIY